MRGRTWLILLVLLALLVPAPAGLAAPGEVKYVDKDALKSLLGAPDLLIIDVRRAADWDSSDRKIQGAVRQDPDRVAAWGPTLPKDKRIVLYCA